MLSLFMFERQYVWLFVKPKDENNKTCMFENLFSSFL